VPLFRPDGTDTRSAVRVASEVRENGRLIGYQMDWRTSWAPLPAGPRATGDTMLPNQILGHDQFLRSADGRYTLYFQADGNLVLVRTHDWSLLWASGSRAAPGALIMQSDGNLVVYADGTGARWASNTMVPNSRLLVQNDGNVVIYRPDGTPIWATNTAEPQSAHGRDIMFPNQVLRPNESMRSSDGRFTLYFQGDGNLVLVRTRDWSLLWASRSFSTNPRIVIMQSDGNLVIYDAWRAIWASGTTGQNNRLVVQNDGNAVIYRPDNRPVWATNTAGR
jgi:hypothetical protein